MFSRKAIVVATFLSLAAIAQPTFAQSAGVAQASKASSAQPCWVTAWVLWITQGVLA